MSPVVLARIRAEAHTTVNGFCLSCCCGEQDAQKLKLCSYAITDGKAFPELKPEFDALWNEHLRRAFHVVYERVKTELAQKRI